MDAYMEQVREFCLQTFGADITRKHERIALVKESYLAFCLIYLRHYFTLDPADFHSVLISILSDFSLESIAVIGYRGSAKSVHCSFAFPLWCAVTVRYHFTVIINDTDTQMELAMANMKAEIEQNVELRADFEIDLNAPQFTPDGQKMTKKWAKTTLLLPNGTFILGLTRGMKIRGLRFRQYRPELVIIDDAEDTEWVRKKPNRDKTERWLNSEVIPAQSETRCKLVIIGNLLHSDALMCRIKRRRLFRVLEIPMFDEDGCVTWPAKYPTQEAVQKQREKVKSVTTWLREYCLKIVGDAESPIKETDIRTYPIERLRPGTPGVSLVPKAAGLGLDFAISEKETADYTAGVSGVLVNDNGVDRVFIMPNPIHDRIDLPKTLDRVEVKMRQLPNGAMCFPEDVGYQKAAIKMLEDRNIPVTPVRPVSDKRSRLETAGVFVKNGQVVFPECGCEELIQELVGFGAEEHDDLADAFVMVVLGLLTGKRGGVGVGRSDAL